MESAAYTEITSRELNELIQKHYNIPSFECDLGLPSSNTVLKEFNINKDYSTKMKDEDGIKKIMAEGSCEYDQITFILWDLCRTGALAEGNYLIDCSW